MGARRFGPDTGRFLQADAYDDALGNLSLSADPLTANRYGLAGGNPVGFVEVDGHNVSADGGGGSAPTPKPSSGRGISGFLGDRVDNVKSAASTVKRKVRGGAKRVGSGARQAWNRKDNAVRYVRERAIDAGVGYTRFLRDQVNEATETIGHGLVIAEEATRRASRKIVRNVARAADTVDDLTEESRVRATKAGRLVNSAFDATADYLEANTGKAARALAKWGPKAAGTAGVLITAYSEFSHGLSMKSVGRTLFIGTSTVAAGVLCGLASGGLAAVGCGIGANILAGEAADVLFGEAG